MSTLLFSSDQSELGHLLRHSVPIHENPYAVRTTREVMVISGGHFRETAIYVYSFACFFQAQRGVLWHENGEHCPTWTGRNTYDGECRCDVEPPQ